MPYQIALPNGQFAQFSDDVAQDDARRQIFDAFPEFFSEEDHAYFGRQDIERETSALGRGFRSAYETTTGNVGALGRYGLGGTFEQLQADIAEAEKQAAQQNPYATSFEDVTQSFSEGFFPGLERLGSYVGETAGSSVPYLVGTLGGAVAGTAVGGPAGTVSGAVAPFAGAIIGATPQFFADNIARQIQEGAENEEAIDWDAAFGAAIAQGGLNAVAPLFTGIVGRGVMGPVVQQAVIKQTLDKIGKIPGGRFAAAGITASQVEGLTEVLQQGLERAQAGLPAFEEEETLAAYTGGAMLGLIMGGAGAVITPRRKSEEDFEETPVEEPLATAVPLVAPDAPLALPAPSTETPRPPTFDVRPETGETPADYAERAIRVAGADFPEGPFRQIVTPNGYQIVNETGDYVGQPFATPEQAQEVLNVYNRRGEELALEKQAQEAIKNTRQTETAELLAAARETVAPLGTFSIDEVGTALAGRVNARRIQTGLQPLDTFTIEDLAKIKAPETEITRLINSRRPVTTATLTQPEEVLQAAQDKGIVSDDENFKIFARRTTGATDVNRMNQTQLQALQSKIDELPQQAEGTTLPVIEQPLFTETEYDKAVSGIQRYGRFTQKLLSEVTGIRDRKALQALRDRMVGRGALIKRNENDYRLSELLGRERRTTPADLPEGTTKNHVVREIPIGKLRLRKDGKSLGTFDSETEARARIRNIREKEAEKGDKPSVLQLLPADGTAFAVVENRYDGDGNFLGQAPIDTRRTREEAQTEADKLDGREEIQSNTAPVKPPPPEALRGRVGDVMEALKDLSYQRELPLLGTKVKMVGGEMVTLEGDFLEGGYSPAANTIFIAVRDLHPDMSTKEIVERLAQVMDHELVHALREAGILAETSPAWQTLERYVKRAKRPEGNETYYQFARRKYSGRAGYDKPADTVEEAIAEAFRYWAADRRAVGKKPASVFQQIARWFKKLLGMLPDEIFETIAQGDVVRDALTPPGSLLPRPRYIEEMAAARTELNAAADRAKAMQELAERSEGAEAENAANEAGAAATHVETAKAKLRRLQAQAREDRRGRAGPRTILGMTPSRGFAQGARGDNSVVRGVADTYRQATGDTRPPADIYLEEDPEFYFKAADIHQKANHRPGDIKVAKSYNALMNELKAQFQQIGELDIESWTQSGEPYTSPEEMLADIAQGHLFLRMSNDMFGSSPANAGHPLFEASGFKTRDGRDLTFNDVLRVTHDYYGHGQYGFKYTPRDAYNAYHQHARLFSEEARPALAAETLGPVAWQNFGPQMRRPDGTVPARKDADYLSQSRREFAPHKAYVFPEDVLKADPGLDAIRQSETVDNTEIILATALDKKMRFSLGKRTNLRLEPWGQAEGDSSIDLFMITTPDGTVIGQVAAERTRVDKYIKHIADAKNIENVEIDDEIVVIDWVGDTRYKPAERQEELYRRTAEDIAAAEPGPMAPGTMKALSSWLVEHYPDAKWISGYRVSGSRGTKAGAVEPSLDANARADGYQFVPTEPFRERLRKRLPGGGEFGKEQPLGSEFSPPDTRKPRFSFVRDGNEKFGGDIAEAQLLIARTGEDGAFLVYMSPEQFTRLAGAVPLSPDQTEQNELVKHGYRYNTLPGAVITGLDGVVKIAEVDGMSRVRALQADNVTQVPVMIYPDKKVSTGLITGFYGKGGRLPAFPRAEYMPDHREIEPKYSVKAALGERVPRETEAQDFDLTYTMADTVVGRVLHDVARSKRRIPVLGFSVFDARRKLQDRMLPVKEMIERIKDAGGKVSDFANTYMLENLTQDQIMDRIRQRQTKLYTPLFEAIRNMPGVSVKDLEQYLYARHAPERNAELVKRGLEDPAGSGMTNEEASKIMDRLAREGKLQKVTGLAVMMDNIIKDTNRVRVAAGLTSQETVDASPFKHYVPLRGFADEDLDPDMDTDQQYLARVQRGYSVHGREDKTFTGRQKRAGSIIEHVIQQNLETQMRAGRNQVAQSLAELFETNPANGFGEILDRAPTKRIYNKRTGQIQNAPDPMYKGRNDIIIAKKDGQEVIMELYDPGVARAIKGALPGEANGLIRALMGVNRFLSSVNTSWNPEFLISNLARDIQTARILIEQHDVPGLSRSIIRDVPASMRAIRAALRDGVVEGEMGRMFADMRADGGTSELLGINDIENQIRRIQNDMGTMDDTKLDQVKTFMGRVGKFVDDYNRVAENAVRLSAYANARRRGVSRLQAANLSKNLTVNFNKGGEWRTTANALYLFYNASLQGTVVLLNGLKNRKVQKIAAGIVASGMMQDTMNRLMSGDENDNGIPDYDEIPQYILEHNFVLMDPLGVLRAVGIDKGYFAIPMPYGFNSFHNMGRNMSAVMHGSPVHTPAKAAGSIIASAFNSFNPIGGTESFINFVSPTILDPFVDIASNRDFADRPISPERKTHGLALPDSQLYWNSTAGPFKWTAETLNNLTGGSPIRKGLLDISPETLEYFYDYALGAAGGFAKRTLTFGDTVTDATLRGDFSDIEVGQIPFLRKLVGSVEMRGNTQAYYENAEAVMTAAEELEHYRKTGNLDGARSVYANYGTDLSLAGSFKAADKSLQQLRKQLRQVRDNDSISDESRELLEQRIRDQMDAIMLRMNRLYYSMQGG